MEDQLRQGPTLIQALWEYRVVVLLALVIMGGTGYLLGAQGEEQFEAEAQLYLSNPNTSGAPGDPFSPSVPTDEYIPQQAALMNTRLVLDAAIALLDNPPSRREASEGLQISANAEELSISISATASSGPLAANIANAMAEAYRNQRESTALQRASEAVVNLQESALEIRRQIDVEQSALEGNPESVAAQTRVRTLSDQVEAIESDIRQTLLDVELRGDGVDLFEAASVPDSPSAPRPRITAIIFAFLGFLGAAMWAYWYAGQSQRVLNRLDPEAILQVPLLGEIPLYRTRGEESLGNMFRVDPAAAEAYEFVLSSIEFAMTEVDGKSLLITSALPGDGKTTTSLQLAIAASRDKRRVVLLDADIRARGLTRVLGAEDRVGLSDIAALDLKTADVMRRYRFSEESQIPIITAGQRRGDPASLLRTRAFRRAIASINQSAELLMVDASPLLAVADATILAGLTDAMVIVVSHGTPVSELQKVRERLKFVSTPLIGYIFNRSESTTAAAYGYGYGLTEDDDGERRLLPRSQRKPEPAPATPAKGSEARQDDGNAA